jgi:hypothetical protein
MGRHHGAAALLCFCLLCAASTLDGREPLRMRVSPAVAMAPGFVTVRVSVEAAAENRTLQVVAESPDFYRSSQIQLNGAQAAPLAVFEFRNLPSGLYQVTGTLVGVNGPRATVAGLAKVQPSPGR